jgi:hypothetical protein
MQNVAKWFKPPFLWNFPCGTALRMHERRLKMTNDILIPLLSVSTFVAAIGFFVWQYYRVRKSQEKRDEL